MKSKLLALTFILLTVGTHLSAQRSSNYYDNYGRTLNIGLGVGGYSESNGYFGHTLPVFDINYEFGVARNFTLAPFLTIFSYSDGNYRALATPIGVKGTLYLDQLLRAGSNWDFYTAGSVGAAIVRTTWDANYSGDRTYYRSVDPLYLDLHLGIEYHLNNNIGAFVDFSTGVTTVGIAIH